MLIPSSTAGLYPVPVARQSIAIRTDNDVASKDAVGTAAQVTAAIDQAARQKTGEATGETPREILPATDVVQASRLAEGRDLERSNAEELTQQFNRISIERFSERSAEGLIQNAAQRAVTAYTDVATQEHRDELVQLLGIDVFA